jgi:hypothetical protein
MLKKSLLMVGVFGLASVGAFATTANTQSTASAKSTAIIQEALTGTPEKQYTLAGLFTATDAQVTKNPSGTFDVTFKPQTRMFIVAENAKLGTAVNQISLLKFDTFVQKYAQRFGFKSSSKGAGAAGDQTKSGSTGGIAKLTSSRTGAAGVTGRQYYLAGVLTLTTKSDNVVTLQPKIIKYDQATGMLTATNSQKIGDMSVSDDDITSTSGSVVVAFSTPLWKAVTEHELNAAGLTTEGAKNINSYMTVRNLETTGTNYPPNVALFQLNKK